ncbi:hypothetical protein BDD14_5978 [Edaphobacter modestus]|uniref:Uncharacterized protein n=1 Tax=Edaphobacter modestus TaxID=388466 RepID=A0A4Q7YE26_9BACT|nr:hypothetical protein BDD14_5978 [Edaphobacter modestus]
MKLNDIEIAHSMRATSGVKAYVYGTPTLCVLNDRMLGRSVETRLVSDE